MLHGCSLRSVAYAVSERRATAGAAGRTQSAARCSLDELEAAEASVDATLAHVCRLLLGTDGALAPISETRPLLLAAIAALVLVPIARGVPRWSLQWIASAERWAVGQRKRIRCAVRGARASEGTSLRLIWTPELQITAPCISSSERRASRVLVERRASVFQLGARRVLCIASSGL